MCTYICSMASLNISLKKEAYEHLVALQRPGESFSDTVLRMGTPKTAAGLLECMGLWSDLTPQERKAVEKGVRSARMTMKSVLDKWKE